MLTSLKPQAEDKIIGLMKLYADDPRPQKVDLGVGVYKNAEGVTPIMRAVKTAERQLWEAETTKTYTGLAGDPSFAQALAPMILGPALDLTRLAFAAQPGGTGAVRHALELVKEANPDAVIHTSDPTWPNHLSIIDHLGLARREYRYFDSESRAVDFEAMMADLANIGPGDVVLLHGCCHNPTGANLTLPEWEAVADHILKTGALALVDLAYQGIGDGLEKDAGGVRLLASKLPELLIAASCSKNFGIYRERTGLLIAQTPNTALRDITQANLTNLNRQNFSFPPDHGARLVTMILNDDALKADWMAELEEVRTGMLTLRRQLADELRARTGSDRFGFLADHRGMFSRLGASPEQVEAMRKDHAVYMVGDSRMNIAGLNAKTVPILADAIVAAGV